MYEHKINSLDSFICGWYSSNTTICDRLISYYDTAKIKGPGKQGSSYSFHVDVNVKNSIDCPILDQQLLSDYILFLQESVNLYIKKYPFCDAYLPWTIKEDFQIQHYLPGNSFSQWHTERGTGPTLHRHLVFMTYLNTVEEAGETEFFHQKIKVKPEKGLTLIWPADWTFTHRGLPAPVENKFIVTGWFSFYNPT